MKRIRTILPCAALLLTLFSCHKTKKYPIEPEITFKQFEQYKDKSNLDSTVIMVISFTDGDGDIGLRQSDTLAPYNPGSVFYYNFFLKYFRKENGVYNEMQLISTPNQRIPFVDVNSSIKSISGDIRLKLELTGLIANNDTFRFEASIADRALHVSNIIITPDLVLKTQ